MPVFSFGKQRLHPHFAFAHGLLVSERLLLGTNPLEILLSHMTRDATPSVTGRPLRFEWAGLADGSRSAIELTPVRIDSPHPLQQLALRTALLISLWFIAAGLMKPVPMLESFPLRTINPIGYTCPTQGHKIACYKEDDEETESEHFFFLFTKAFLESYLLFLREHVTLDETLSTCKFPSDLVNLLGIGFFLLERAFSTAAPFL